MSFAAYKIFIAFLQLPPRFPTHTFLRILLGGCFIEYRLLFLYSNYVYEWSCPLWTYIGRKLRVGIWQQYFKIGPDQWWVNSHGATTSWEAEHSSLTHTSAHMGKVEDTQSQQCHLSCSLFMFRKKSVNICCSCMLIVLKSVLHMLLMICRFGTNTDHIELGGKDSLKSKGM